MKKIAFLCLLFISAGLVSCEDTSADYVGDQIVGRTWTGDVGMRADNGAPLFSSFRFGSDGFGSESQYYSNGSFYQEFRYKWYFESEYSSNLVLDYGNFGISYMDNVRVYGQQMTGTFFLDDGAVGYGFTLRME